MVQGQGGKSDAIEKVGVSVSSVYFLSVCLCVTVCLCASACLYLSYTIR